MKIYLKEWVIDYWWLLRIMSIKIFGGINDEN